MHDTESQYHILQPHDTQNRIPPHNIFTVATTRTIPACHLIGSLAAKRYIIRFGLKHISRTRR